MLKSKLEKQLAEQLDSYIREKKTQENCIGFIDGFTKASGTLTTVSSIDFAIWLQDNYSQNDKQGSTNPLPKGNMRKDFTDDVYTIEEIYNNHYLPLFK